MKLPMLWERLDARSAAMLVCAGGTFPLPLVTLASSDLLRPGMMPVVFGVWLYVLGVFVFTLRVGRLSDRQFVVIASTAMVAIAIAAFAVTDPAAARAIVALLSAFPVMAAMASARRVTLVFTLMALLFAAVLSVYWSTTVAARLVAAGASVLTICIPVFMVAALRSSLEFAMEKLALLGEIDPLTGALNRRGLIRRHALIFDRAITDGVSVGFLLIDIDHFKEVNDIHGHAAGDRVLVDTVRAIENAAPRPGLVNRLGGEEFVVLCVVHCVADLSATATRVRMAVAEQGQVTVSVGAVLAPIELARGDKPNASEIVDDLTSHADRSVYWAKGHGRNRVILQIAPTIAWRRGSPDEIRPARVNIPGADDLSDLVRNGLARYRRKQIDHSQQ